MSNLQKTLELLQPYVIGIRYLKGITLVDVVLNEGWTLPDDSKIIRTNGGDETVNYHMIHSDTPGIELDELLAYVDKTIKVNLDREKKHELLKTKVNQLKELFKKTPLSKLERLKFTFGDEDFMTSMSDIDIDIEEPIMQPVKKIQQQIDEPYVEDVVEPIVEIPASTAFLDEDGKPIEMTEEELELAAEEARAERNLRILENRKNQKPNNSKKVELPPKRQVAMANEINYDADCECSESEACEKCIDRKDY